MKLSILNSGIQEPIKNDMQDARDSLNKNKYISLICPNTFSYASYIGGLRDKTNKYLSEINKITEHARSHEDSYDDLFYTQTKKVEGIIDPNIKERQGLTNRVEDLASYDVSTGSFKSEIEVIEKRRNEKVKKAEIPKMKMKG